MFQFILWHYINLFIWLNSIQWHSRVRMKYEWPREITIRKRQGNVCGRNLNSVSHSPPLLCHSLWMQNAKFNKSTKNNANRPERERLHILSVPTCSKISITSFHLLLFLTYSQFATPLCFPQCCPSHLLFKYFPTFCSPFRTRHQA